MDQQSWLAVWKQRARGLKQEAYALYLACKDRRTPWYAKVLALGVVGYALSPIDLIPDFIPVLGYLDDLILVPAGIVLVRQMIPDAVMRDCRERAQTDGQLGKPTSWLAAGIVAAVWLAFLAIVIGGCIRFLRG